MDKIFWPDFKNKKQAITQSLTQPQRNYTLIIKIRFAKNMNISIFRVNRTQINKFRRKLYLFDQKSDQGIFRIIFEKTWLCDNLVAYITMSATISKNHGKVLYTKKSVLIAIRLGE